MAILLSLSMLTGCLGFLLVGTNDTESSENQVGVKPVNRDGFVEIIPPKEGITGLAIDPVTNPISKIEFGIGENKKVFLYKGSFVEGTTTKIKPYLIGESEVTYKLWREVYNWAIQHGYRFGKGHCIAPPRDDPNAPNIRRPQQALPEASEYANRPVIGISMLDYMVWCNAYTEMKTNSDDQCVYRLVSNDEAIKDGTWPIRSAKGYCDTSKKGYRLPTSAEWEYAARWQKDNSNNNAVRHGRVWLTKLNSLSGSNLPAHFTHEEQRRLRHVGVVQKIKNMEYEANRVAVLNFTYVNRPKGRKRKERKTSAVKTKDPNDCGLYDMSGNAWEWCFTYQQDINQHVVFSIGKT